MQKCEITGKGKQFGHNVSFSLRRTSKTWKPNLQTKTVVIDGKKTKIKVSAAGIRTLKKKGLLPTTASAQKINN
ncbi:50S ribosomal protein L28 [Candidatus Saccharibacteria bacterium RIFCSPHIGHO2_12_FULL_41_12]|nr:MAG: 50S ribosomal protein L28 [Candidatus Saccharibacteria bacterium RIFCSPHIGHO2_12_FULL_41_12]